MSVVSIVGPTCNLLPNLYIVQPASTPHVYVYMYVNRMFSVCLSSEWASWQSSTPVSSSITGKWHLQLWRTGTSHNLLITDLLQWFLFSLFVHVVIKKWLYSVQCSLKCFQGVLSPCSFVPGYDNEFKTMEKKNIKLNHAQQLSYILIGCIIFYGIV